MTDVALPDTSALATGNIERLDRWVKQARAVSEIAADICATSFAPAAYRNKPAEATAAILAGAELGFDPMASLRAFDNIGGVPAPKALTLRAVVLSKGHELVIEESTPTRAVVSGRRRGSDRWQTSIWDIERAAAMPQFKSNPNYKTIPEQMLVARATAEVCRWIASDAIMGMPYAAEELADHPALEARPAARKLTVADLDEPAPPEPAEVTLEDVLARIGRAESADVLEEIKRDCLAAGLLDDQVKEAWVERRDWLVGGDPAR